MILRIALSATLVVLLGIGLLYAFRSQAPAAERIDLGSAIAEVQHGGVRAIVIGGDEATMTLADGRRQSVAIGGRGPELVRAAVDHNASDPSHPVEIRSEQPGPMFSIGLAFALLATLLPLLFLIAAIVLAAYVFDRSRAGHRYELLARMADLRDRGALTEEEFQREKARVLR